MYYEELLLHSSEFLSPSEEEEKIPNGFQNQNLTSLTVMDPLIVKPHHQMGNVAFPDNLKLTTIF